MDDKNDLVKQLLLKRKKVNYDEIEIKLKEKFKDELENWSLVSSLEKLKLEKGYPIRYIDLDMKKIKTGLLVKCIEKKKNIITSLLLKNSYTNTVWLIKPCSYYIMKKSSSKKSEFVKWLEEITEKK